ncbi:MAG TPA: twin-arginine translocase TatA/TatE family subunit [Ktedonobacterales bacterium]|jgi:sec-independent protein translocase protein TatA|nr:twin-arginine translocase TatA/TatE family subunit [Ktedonobacterales bacterium]
MPGFRPEYLIPLVLLALLFFGPKRIPEMGSAIGKTIKEFQKSMREPDAKDTASVTPPVNVAATPQIASPAPAATNEIASVPVTSAVADPAQH